MRTLFPFDKSTEKIINAVAALVVVLDERGRIRFFNKACEQLTGYSFQEMKEQYVWDSLLPPDEIEATKIIFDALVAQKMPNKHTNHWVDKQGLSHLISWSNTVIRSTRGDELYIIGTGVDISQRSEMMDLLAERGEKFKAIFDSAIDGIIIADNEGKMEQVNFAVGQMFGYKSSELEGRNVNILIPEPERHHHDGYLRSYLESGKKKIIDIGREVIGQRKDQSVFPFYLSVTEIFFDHTRSFVALLHDLTERNKYLDDLHQAQKMEALGQLTGGLAHDFNNLLTVILGDLEMLHDSVSSPDGKALLDDAIASVDLGAQLIERLLAFGRRQPLLPKVVNINRLLSGMRLMLNRVIGENIEIEESFKEKIWPIYVDPGLIENAILNLILNARDALPQGGKIILKTDNYVNESEGKYISDLAEGPYVRISIVDNGSGMSPHTLVHMYEPFFTTKPSGSGTGLGLSMVYGFVKQSGGNIKISSQLERGTTVDIYLPKTDGGLAGQNKPEVVKHLFSRDLGETILYVEDDPKVRQVNARRLLELGYNVFTAKDGPSALDILAKQGPVDLLFTDIVMPGGMSGKELGDLVRRQQPDIKVILTTGYAEQISSGDAREENLLKKPYSREILAAYLRQVFEN